MYDGFVFQYFVVILILILLKPRCDYRDFLSSGAVGGTAGRRVLIG